MSLEDMLISQKQLQEVFDARAVSDDPKESCEYIKDMSLALLDEVHELLGEVGWKPWATSKHINTAAARGEWIDAWHFMMNLANKLGMTAHMIEEMYTIKAEANRRRIAQGYDGVTSKCPGCGRDFGDAAVDCHVLEENPIYAYCYEHLDVLPRKVTA